MSAAGAPPATPTAYLATDLEAWQARWDEAGGSGGSWRTLADLLQHDGATLRSAHASLVEAGEPPAAAAKYLVGWVGGLLAGAVAHGYALTGAGFLPGPATAFRVQPGGWPDRVDLGTADVVVPHGHPWAGVAGVRTLGPEPGCPDRDPVADPVADAVVAGLREVLTPLIDRVRTLAKVGPVALWAEVADGLATAVANQPEVPATLEAVAAVERLTRAAAAPWRKRPALWVGSCAHGPTVIGQKGGCCLAYTRPEVDLDLAAYPEAHRRFYTRFPPGSPRYCGNCSFREPADVEAREVFWIEERLGRPEPPEPA